MPVRFRWKVAALWLLFVVMRTLPGEAGEPLTLSWNNEMLSIRGPKLPGGEVKVWYLEAFCRPGSTRRDWKETVIPHRTRLIESGPSQTRLRLRSELSDGVIVDSEIRSTDDEIDFRVVASNPGKEESHAHWAQPCIRVDQFTGTRSERNSEAYLPSSFIEIGGQPARMPTRPWATEALYTPGQVWCPNGVSRQDVNPRPLSELVPSSGLIGCVSRDGSQVLATAWEPCQELFQGVIVCLHSDFRIGGLKAGESRTIRGKIYVVPANYRALKSRYERDFPEHRTRAGATDGPQRTRKLIEFGWDEPDTAFLKAHQEQVERAPFDGCVFHANASPQGRPAENFTWLCWGKRKFTDEEMNKAFDDLQSISWKRFKHNFLRFNVAPADIDWFDDHSAVMSNARLVARLASAGRCQGILLDTEQYQGRLFQYSKQRFAAEKSWDEYAAQVRARGREFMTALQEGFPGLTVMATFGPSLAWRQGEGGKPLAERDYGLLVPFFDGMCDAAKGSTRIIDGFEISYGFREPEQFERGLRMMFSAEEFMADRSKARRLIEPGFGLWLDYDWRQKGWRIDNPGDNHFSPARFQEALQAAFERTSEYVWIYSETPRWWTDRGDRVALPEGYVEAILQARKGFCAD